MRIELRDHDRLWAGQFEALRARLAASLGDRVLRLEHVGSTAVPGLCAKPVLDLLLVVADSAAEASYAGPIESCGYVLRHRESDWYEHRMFVLAMPAANLHVLSAGCPEIERMVRFRDLLRTDERAREAYADRKRELAGLEWSQVQEYADAKSAEVERLLATAGDTEDGRA